MKNIAVLLLLVLGLTSCATMDTVKNAPLDQGIAQNFNAPYDQTVAATLKALSSLNVNISSSSQDTQGTIYLVSKSASLSSWGEVGRVFVKRTPVPPTIVMVVWENRDQMQISDIDNKDFSQALFSNIAKAF